MGSCHAVKHLAKQGFTRILFLNGPAVYSNSLDRLEGYRQGLEEAGLTYDPSMVLVGNYSRKSGYKQAEAVLG